MAASNNIVAGNVIGLSASGAPLGNNGGSGVLITEGSGNQIGGAAAGEGNVLAYNAGRA